MRRIFVPSLVITVLGAALLVPVRASGQNLTAGVKAGVNFANVDITASDVTVTPEQRVGFIGGVFVGLDINDKGGLIVEALFSQRGTRAKFTEDGVTVTDSFDVDYIEFPVLGRVTLKASDAVRVHLFAGPSFAFKVNDSEKVELNGVDVTAMFPRTELKSFDTGLTFGGTLDIRRVLIDVRYTYGLTNIDDTPGDDDIEVKNRTFSVMAGFRFK
jgi:hypothetical protein